MSCTAMTVPPTNTFTFTTPTCWTSRSCITALKVCHATYTAIYIYLLQAVSACWAPYTACANNSNAINSRGFSCSEPAYSTLKLRLHAGNFCEKCHFFGNDDPYRHKKLAHVLLVVVTRLCEKFRHRTTQRLGGDRPHTK